MEAVRGVDTGQSWIARHWLAIVFLVVNLIGGLRLAYLTPMGQVPDEPAHIARTGGLLHGEIIGKRLMTKNGPTSGTMVNDGLINASLSELGQGSPHPVVSSQDRSRARAIHWSTGHGFDMAPNTEQYFPLFYAPGAVGISIGRLSGLRPLSSLYLGRAFMLMGFLAIGTLALVTAQFGSVFLFALLGLPMTLSLAASFNQDGMIIASSVLVAALLTHDPSVRPWFRWIAAGIFAVVISSKPPYGLLIFCAALPMLGRGVFRRLIVAGLFGLPALVWVLFMMHTTFAPMRFPAYHPGPLWTGNPAKIFHTVPAAENLKIILAHPGLILTMPMQTLFDPANNLLNEFIGILGWLDVGLPSWLTAAWVWALVLACLGGALEARACARSWFPADAAFVFIMIVGTIYAVCMALYLSWTHVGSPQIIGIQGRYFIPVVPFLILAIPRLDKWGSRVRYDVLGVSIGQILAALPAIILSIYGAWMLPLIVQKAFL